MTPPRIFLALAFCLCALTVYSQPPNCVFKETQLKINFGAGYHYGLTNARMANYQRVISSCPTDGYYSYASFTSDCFHGDWQTLTEDHTPGDADGNMLLVNGAPSPGMFLKTTIDGFKPATTYEFGVWLMNLCRITEKCGLVLLPNLTISLQTPEGNVIAKFATGDVPRLHAPQWTQHRAIFKTPAGVTTLILSMVNNAPGGCGNDFAVDDIGFRECVIVPPPVTTAPKPVATKQLPPAKQPAAKPVQRPVTTTAKPVVTKEVSRTSAPKMDSPIRITKSSPAVLPPPPAVLTSRTNSLVKRIEAPPGEIKIELYDNGEIDGDTVSIYHNNTLIKSRARLSAQPISFSIMVNEAQPYHELIMVANNLGSIPPNTSVMIITAGSARHEVFISSTEQKNAKVVIDLRVPPPQ